MSNRLGLLCAMTCLALFSSNSMAQGRRGGGGGGGGQSGGSRSAPMIINPSSYSSSQQWEYGKLEVGAGQIIWRGSGEKFEAKSLSELAAKLTNPTGSATTSPATTAPADKPAGDATADADDDLAVWNLLGTKGWEFVESEVFAAPTGQGHQMVYRFKRQKH